MRSLSGSDLRFPGVKKGDYFLGSQGGVVLRAPEGSFFGVQAGLGVPKGCIGILPSLFRTFEGSKSDLYGALKV